MPKSSASQTRVGISGWTYAPWRGVFYPKGLTHARELEFASRMLNSIEINGTFYSLQRPTTFARWHDATPADFMFAVKGPRFITHLKRLRDVEAPLANFLASGPLALKGKLGPILWQFPPNFSFEEDRLAAFFKLLPKTTVAAAAMARNHDSKLKGDAFTDADADRKIRYAVEVRHPSFESPRFIELLREHHIALVFADTAGKWSFGEDLTSDFVYARLHGDELIYVSGYSPEALEHWAARLRRWQAGKQPADAKLWSDVIAPKAAHRDVFVYFDNDVKVRAPVDAMALAKLLGPSARGEVAHSADGVAPARLTQRALSERVRPHWPAPPRKLSSAPKKNAK